MSRRTTILVAPLNWGLGHASRCIPLINALLDQKFNVLLGSDGASLQLLRKEFPLLPFLQLPSYDIVYPKNGLFFKLNLLLSLPRIRGAIDSEKEQIAQWVSKGKIDGIISDNRPGIFNPKVPSVYLTHQATVLSGNTSFFSSSIHRRYIKNFDECWIPDVEGSPNLSGVLGHPKNLNFPVRYIGPLSRMKATSAEQIYDVLAPLSGPEPQRSLLEKKLIQVFKGTSHKLMLVQGLVEDEEKREIQENITMVNFMTTKNLERAMNQSKWVVCRAGYSSIMDLAALGKRAFLIPTPGQYEQNYLARQLKQRGIAPSCRQREFTLLHLDEIKNYSGFEALQSPIDYADLFRLFKGE